MSDSDVGSATCSKNTKQAVWVCPHCGVELSVEAGCCPSCGSLVDYESEAQLLNHQRSEARRGRRIATIASSAVFILVVLSWCLVAYSKASMKASVRREVRKPLQSISEGLQLEKKADPMVVRIAYLQEVLQPGVWIDDFPKVKLYFTRKEGDVLYDLVILDTSGKIERKVWANRALVCAKGKDVTFDLTGVTFEPLDEGLPGKACAGRVCYVVKDALPLYPSPPKKRSRSTFP